MITGCLCFGLLSELVLVHQSVCNRYLLNYKQIASCTRHGHTGLLTRMCAPQEGEVNGTYICISAMLGVPLYSHYIYYYYVLGNVYVDLVGVDNYLLLMTKLIK